MSVAIKEADAADPLDAAAFKSWLEVVRGSWSKSDAEIYVAGFKAGWMERGRAIAEAMEGDDGQRE